MTLVKSKPLPAFPIFFPIFCRWMPASAMLSSSGMGTGMNLNSRLNCLPLVLGDGIDAVRLGCLIDGIDAVRLGCLISSSTQDRETRIHIARMRLVRTGTMVGG